MNHLIQSSAQLLATTAADESGLMDFTYKIQLSDIFIAIVSSSSSSGSGSGR